MSTTVPHSRLSPGCSCSSRPPSPPPRSPQNATGEIGGYVRDASGAVIPGVTVTLAYPDIAYSRLAVTNADGYYVFPGVPNGTADLKAELTGFQPASKRGVQVELNARMRVDLTMQVGAVSEQVEVVGAAGTTISTRADVAHLVSGEQTREIPIDGRSYMQLVNIIPGVSRNEGSYEFGTSFRADGQQINGLRKNFSGLTLDGSENLDAGSNATQVNNVSIDAIDEFKVLTSQYAAEYGKAGGAQINVVTKSGKRNYSGGLYTFVRNDRFDARDFQTGQKAKLDFKNYGWTLGGPVRWNGFNQDRSRLFFFVAQEWKDLETQVGLSRTATTPSLLERQGNFTQSPRVPNDPLTGQPFAGGTIPAARLSPAGLALAARFPQPDRRLAQHCHDCADAVARHSRRHRPPRLPAATFVDRHRALHSRPRRADRTVRFIRRHVQLRAGAHGARPVQRQPDALVEQRVRHARFPRSFHQPCP